ncbi:Heat shock 70 kDa protein cognate 4 [Orchesella cincta]|uniref:Heat shock 70 kDa protein cognate 4 n=1 Tax=Orchesella cincta TaxID=48709 RepID=A0A1D2MEA0_ORCCI|nr:Heat shock 70 kDa protein cognate 4 [Orchesella cincta]
MDNYKSKDDVTYAQQKYMEKCSSVLDRKIRSGNTEVKNELLGKCKKFFANTCNVIAESLELNSERDRLKLSKLLGDLRTNYHEEMTISVKSNSYPNVGAINKLHKKVLDKIIDSLTRRDSIQLSPEQRQNLVNSMEDSVTKYRIDFSLNSSNQMEDPAIGIDLGTTYCCVTVIWRDQRMKIISSSEGSDTTPSYVAFHEDGSHVVGQTAKDAAYRNPESTIFDAKRMIGRRITDANLRRDIMFWPFEIKDCNGIPKIDIRGQMIPPEQISAILLANLKSQAEEQLGMQISKAVITVPAYFSDGQRAATKDAAEMAGLEVLTILNEPTAAAIAYKMEHFSEKPKKVLVFDLGGGTFDVAVLQTAATSIEVLSVDGDTHLGGEDFDKNLMDECVRIFRRKAGIDLFEYKDSDSKPKREDARRMIRRLQTYCEKAKRQLSSAMHATISVDGLAQGHDFHEVFSRSKFEELNKTLFRQTIEVVDKALEGAKLKKKDIDDILLVGGSTRIPKIKEMLSKHFNNKTLSHSVHPDIAVAYGAAIQAALLNGGDTDDLLKFETIRDVTPMSLGISASLGKKVDQLMVVIPKNTKIPHRATESFRTSFKNQDFMRISVYQGMMQFAAIIIIGNIIEDIPTSNKDRLSEAEKQKISNSIRKSKVTQKHDDDSPDNKSSDDESTGSISSDDEPIKKPQSFKNQSSVLSESSSDSEPDDLEEW